MCGSGRLTAGEVMRTPPRSAVAPRADIVVREGIVFTDGSASKVEEFLSSQQGDVSDAGLRVGVKGGGCSGFTYMLDLTEEPKGEMDEEIECNGVKILCDMKSYLYLTGVEIDFKDEVMGRGFVFKNPNATSTCGCGSSFQA